MRQADRQVMVIEDWSESDGFMCRALESSAGRGVVFMITVRLTSVLAYQSSTQLFVSFNAYKDSLHLMTIPVQCCNAITDNKPTPNARYDARERGHDDAVDSQEVKRAAPSCCLPFDEHSKVWHTSNSLRGRANEHAEFHETFTTRLFRPDHPAPRAALHPLPHPSSPSPPAPTQSDTTTTDTQPPAAYIRSTARTPATASDCRC